MPRRRTCPNPDGDGPDKNVAEQLRQALESYAMPDALMLRRVRQLRATTQSIDRELAQLERYFTGNTFV
jgi:hypothetical protein